MNKQPRLIDADKLLEWINFEIAKKFPDEETQYADGRRSVMTLLKRRIEQGVFSPDPIPLPTIKPGDKVRHGYYGLGKVQEALDSKHVIVKYYSGEICVITNVIDLEVSHD